MCQNFVSKFRFLEFRLLLSRVAPYLQFITTNCLTEKYLKYETPLVLSLRDYEQTFHSANSCMVLNKKEVFFNLKYRIALKHEIDINYSVIEEGYSL